MKLLVRINAVLVIAFTLAGWAAHRICASLREADARRETLTTAGLMLDSALASRAYTAHEIDPLLESRMQQQFLPQSIPFYAATQTFAALRKLHPDFAYSEATLNPTNPRDRATDWQADVIDQFRDHPSTAQIEGERATAMGPSLFLARSIRAQPGCLACHGLASAAPATLLARYGPDNGFGWQPNEVIGAQIVSVPLANAQAGARRAFAGVTTVIVAMLVALLAVSNIVIYWMVVLPLRRMTRHAQEVSLGRGTEVPFTSDRGDEFAALGEAFERMRKSLDKAMKMIGNSTRGA